jgi:aldose 1-epimerase
MLELEAGDYRLELAPERGGSVLRFDWRGEPLMRPVCGPGIFDVACFPLVPFSNRIARGRFRAGERVVSLFPNFPGSDHPHPIHGFGWLTPWRVSEAGRRDALLEHQHDPGEWPWAYRATQAFRLSEEGLIMALAVTNLAESAMPAGLGFHPYFPRDPDTRYLGLHSGEWQNSPECLPQELRTATRPIDWWDGRPIATRAVDTAYVGRKGPLTLEWPARGHGLAIVPSAELATTVVYTPAGESYFCVEPVSHMTDAVNRPGDDTGLVWLEPQASMSISAVFAAFAL